jgi:hypothetical protein
METGSMSSGHWIKITKGLPNKPAMAQIRRWCNCTKAEAFLAFFELYCHFDDLTADGFIQYFTKDDADEASGGIKGFGAALESVGWMVFQPEGAWVIEWEKHNGRSAKARSMNSNRQNRFQSKGRG